MVINFSGSFVCPFHDQFSSPLFLSHPSCEVGQLLERVDCDEDVTNVGLQEVGQQAENIN